MARLRDFLSKRRELLGKFLFEVVIVFIGVTGAFALEGARRDREDNRYRQQMIAAMIPLFDDFARHNRLLYDLEPQLAAFDRAVAAGQRPPIPVFRERGGERAPVRSWDGIVATGIPRAFPPKLYFDLSLFFSRQESFSERYVRYITFVETDIDPWQSDPAQFYNPETGRLKPAYVAAILRLHGLIRAARVAEKQGMELKAQLQALH